MIAAHFSSRLDPVDALGLVDCGIHAPTADNHHVVRFQTSGNRIRLVWSRVEPVPAHRILFDELAFGAVIENMTIAASALGRGVNVSLNPARRQQDWIAELEILAAGTSAPDSLARVIRDRVSNRRLYARRRAPESILAQLAGLAANTGGCRVIWLEGRDRWRAQLLLFRAERERFKHKRLHAELFESIRFDVGWNDTAAEGLPPGALEIERPARALFASLQRWEVQRRLNRLGVASLIGARSGLLPALRAAHLALLVTRADHPDANLEAGRAMQRFWLGATQCGLAVQAMASPIAIANQDSVAGWVPQQVSAAAAAALVRLSGQARPVMLFRVGYAAPPTVRAGRNSADAHVLDSIEHAGA
jgi:hypothetical protein